MKLRFSYIHLQNKIYLNEIGLKKLLLGDRVDYVMLVNEFHVEFSIEKDGKIKV